MSREEMGLTPRTRRLLGIEPERPQVRPRRILGQKAPSDLPGPPPEESDVDTGDEKIEVERWIVTYRLNAKVEEMIAVTGESRSRHFDRLAEGTNRGGEYFYQMSTGRMFVLTRRILNRLAEFYGESPVWFLTKPG